MVAGGLLIFCLLVFILAVPGMFGVWLPDALRQKIVIDSLTIEGEGRIELTQEWVGDGYLTLIRHTNPRGRIWEFVIDGDAAKAWSGKVRSQSGECVRVDALGQRYYYFYLTHAVLSTYTRPGLVLEIPEDRSPAFQIK